jgi:predicted ester cyclase
MNRNEIDAFVARWLEAVRAGNPAEFANLVHPQVVDLNTGQASPLAAFQDRARAVQSAFGELEGRVDDLLVDGDRIAWRFTLIGTHRGPFLGEPATGKRITLTGTNFQRLAGGVVIEHFTLLDAFGALRQIRAPG